ncbi:LDL receptor repeat-containing protein egg-1-like [Ruditapes philippinarum]|uniref:LDL receptor repeat-containing protein egg-1-like n=1 Tax=Ruditapes philippinarum TaxID=129788 RepID=UPI00295C0701|nr:LDL receptor repeat-containing protein egg-1-like [Ruditapes philippinarum]
MTLKPFKVQDMNDFISDYPQCSDSEFRCTNGQCIPLEKRCDSYEHCIDGTDENSCDICKEGTFHCDLVRCIPSRLVCDTYADCKDGDDEKSCGQPRHSSCENWWNAGYRNTGIYRLYDIHAVCDFDSVLEEENIFTIFHSFEVTYLGDSLEQIHSTEGELFLANQSSVGMIDILTDPSYTCTQNITQTCIHAVEALAQLNETFNISISCDCVTLTVYPYRAQRTLRYCNDGRVLSDTDVEKHMLFIYSETKNKQRILSYKEGSFPRDAELRLSPIVCKNSQYSGSLIIDDEFADSKQIK